MFNNGNSKEELLEVLNTLKIDNEKLKSKYERDINGHNIAEEALIASEIRYRRLFESAQDGILILDAETGKIVDVNPFLINLLGYSKEQFIEKEIWEIGILKDIIANKDKFLELQLNEYVRYEDLPLETANGKQINVEFVSNVYLVDAHKVIQCNIRDITIRRKMERELIVAKNRAEESDRLKTAFLQNMSHEIRTPLNGIIGFSDMLNSEDLSREDIKEFTYMISQSGNRLIEIINNIIDISKIQTGQVTINTRQISINAIFSDLFLFFSPLAKIKNICLNYCDIDENDIKIYSDELRLHQILTNLVNNAIKFTNSGRIDFGSEIINDVIQFYVKDTGIGIPAQQYDKIFERFIQIEQSHTRNFEGAGLGLAISSGLVDLLGGKIWVESELNKGSTFYFTLPYKPVSDSDKKYYQELTKPLKRSDWKILIAEDDPINAKYIIRILKKSGMNAIHAENGAKAVELVRKIKDIDLILMDIRMPVMNGIEATKLIKQIRPKLPIIVLTAYAFSEEKNKIMEAGCEEYLSKPFKIETLKKMIERYLN